MSDWVVTGEERMPKGKNPLGNPFYGYRRTELELPNGDRAVYHGILVGDCIHTVPLEEDYTTYLVWQSRPNIRRIGQTVVPKTLEVPGGFLNPKLGVEGSVNDELLKEIFKTAASLTYLGPVHPSPGASDETDHVFLAQGLQDFIGPLQERKSTEQDMRVVAVPFGQIYSEMLKSQVPVSGQTLYAMAKVAAVL